MAGGHGSKRLAANSEDILSLLLSPTFKSEFGLIFFTVLPLAQVADAADVCGPGLTGLHDRVIEANREEHGLVILPALPSVITSKAANGYHLKTGQRKWRSGTRLFYPAASCGGKSVLVRQLRGPHFSTCPWCRRRSSMALTAARRVATTKKHAIGEVVEWASGGTFKYGDVGRMTEADIPKLRAATELMASALAGAAR